MMGMMSKVWGPPAWLFLHCVTLCYDPKRKKAYRVFFTELKNVLPCGKCRENYTKIISKGPLRIRKEIFTSKESLSEWFFQVHTKVQSDIYAKTKLEKDKPVIKSPYHWNELYEQFRAQCGAVTYGCDKAHFGKRKMTTLLVSKYKCRKAHTSLKVLTQ